MDHVQDYAHARSKKPAKRQKAAVENAAARRAMRRTAPGVAAALLIPTIAMLLAFNYEPPNTHIFLSFTDTVRWLEGNGTSLAEEALPCFAVVPDVIKDQDIATWCDDQILGDSPSQTLCDDNTEEPCATSSNHGAVASRIFTVAREQNERLWAIPALSRRNVLLDLQLLEYKPVVGYGDIGMMRMSDWRMDGPDFVGMSPRMNNSNTRLITAVIQLSPSDAYEGGNLQVAHSNTSRARGAAVIYISGTPHRAHPVIRGVRRVLVLSVWRKAPYMHPVMAAHRATLVEPRLLALAALALRADSKGQRSRSSTASLDSVLPVAIINPGDDTVGDDDDGDAVGDDVAHWSLFVAEYLLATGATEAALPWFRRAARLDGNASARHRHREEFCLQELKGRHDGAVDRSQQAEALADQYRPGADLKSV